MLSIEMLPADEGDALWIEYGPDGGRTHRILIDCGRKAAYRAVRGRLEAARRAGEDLRFDLFVLTHVDADHIEGAVPLLGDPYFEPALVDSVWFNGWRHHNGERTAADDGLGARQGEYFAGLIRDRGFTWNAEFDHGPVVVPDDGALPTTELDGGMQLTLLSPTRQRLDAMRERWAAQLRQTDEDDPDHIAPGDWKRALAVLDRKPALQPDALGPAWLERWDPDDFDLYAAAPFHEDDKEPNGASIALLAEYEGKRVLLTGDAFPSVLERSLERFRAAHDISGRIELAACKLPHHGSRNNVSSELIRSVRCQRWLVSTNGARHDHPHPHAIARVIEGTRGQRPTFYFNYRCPETEVWEDSGLRSDQGYRTVYGPATGGVRVEL